MPYDENKYVPHLHFSFMGKCTICELTPEEGEKLRKSTDHDITIVTPPQDIPSPEDLRAMQKYLEQRYSI